MSSVRQVLPVGGSVSGASTGQEARSLELGVEAAAEKKSGRPLLRPMVRFPFSLLPPAFCCCLLCGVDPYISNGTFRVSHTPASHLTPACLRTRFQIAMEDLPH